MTTKSSGEEDASSAIINNPKEVAITAKKKGNKGGAIALIAKCPIPGKSKTRLIPLLGLNGSMNLAKAMLSDILMTLDQCVSILNYGQLVFEPFF